VVFNGRFGGVATDVFVPISAVVGIYARENGQGMVFEPEEAAEPPDDSPPEPKKIEGRPSLKVVK
jgi:stringent starvation protein B